MNNFQKIGLIVVVILAAIYVKMAFFGSPDALEQEQQEVAAELQEDDTLQEQEKAKEEKIVGEKVNVFFIAHNNNGEEVYRAIKREYIPEEQLGVSKLKFAVKSLIEGPTQKERKLGVYSEIPEGTRLISLTEASSKIVINLTSDFENGGGTDSLYKRLFQLIKTVKINSNKPLYLQLDGRQVEVIGGEGIMINQPLSEDFANE